MKACIHEFLRNLEQCDQSEKVQILLEKVVSKSEGFLTRNTFSERETEAASHLDDSEWQSSLFKYTDGRTL